MNVKEIIKENWLAIGLLGSIAIVLFGYLYSVSFEVPSDPVLDELTFLAENETSSPALDSDQPAAVLELNSAAAYELELLPGIGPAKAQAIVKDREENGRFESVDELDRVSGIGPATIEKLRDKVRVE